jgi:hypothetical protein
MTDRTYPRPAVSEDALLDALYEAGADRGTVGTGNPNMIGISIDGATEAEIDAIWKRAAINAALKEADEGRFVSAEEMNAWIDSWGTEHELPAPTVDKIIGYNDADQD